MHLGRLLCLVVDLRLREVRRRILLLDLLIALNGAWNLCPIVKMSLICHRLMLLMHTSTAKVSKPTKA